jgi:hypothetical protein
MSVLNDLIEDLFERNSVQVGGGISIALVENAIKIKGELGSTIKDKKKSKIIATLVVPVGAEISVRELTIPIPRLSNHGTGTDSGQQ